MVAITTGKNMSLEIALKNNAAQHPHLSRLVLQKGETFGWDHTACAITYNPHVKGFEQYLLHEFGHAILGHIGYKRDIELLSMERAAWDEALRLAADFTVAVTDETIENALDTYRDWLHSRSVCPNCSATGIQSEHSSYHCISCKTQWRVNEARTCELRRYTTKKRP